MFLSNRITSTKIFHRFATFFENLATLLSKLQLTSKPVLNERTFCRIIGVLWNISKIWIWRINYHLCNTANFLFCFQLLYQGSIGGVPPPKKRGSKIEKWPIWPKLGKVGLESFRGSFLESLHLRYFRSREIIYHDQDIP